VAKRTLGHTGRLLHEERFMQMFGGFSNWRVDSFIRLIEAEKRKGRVLPFVRGLRLSAQLIYLLRELLSGSGLTANWGHLLDSEENFCSCECDVIIHRNGHVGRWDGGTGNPIMDFWFISHEQAVAVISCKSYLKPGDVDEQYCESIKEFVDEVWLFAECCDPKNIGRIRNKAEKCGYEKFWPLYTWNEQEGATPNKEGWVDFVEEVKRLKRKFGR
jgi:hypothetical protein